MVQRKPERTSDTQQLMLILYQDCLKCFAEYWLNSPKKKKKIHVLGTLEEQKALSVHDRAHMIPSAGDIAYFVTFVL